MTQPSRFHFILGTILLVIAPQTHATLGERGPASLAQSKAIVTPSNATVRYQTSQDDVVNIKEFVDTSGMVYAVRWEGPRPPDLNSLLGKYFPEYNVAIVATPFRVPHRHLMADSNNLHISQAGRPGDLHGIVYLKNSLPADVHPEDLK